MDRYIYREIYIHYIYTKWKDGTYRARLTNNGTPCI